MGFRGMSPRQIARLMKKMGIEQKEVEGVKSVRILFADKEWVIESPQVLLIKQAGSESFQISGKRTERAPDEQREAEVERPKVEIPMEDVMLVASQAGVDPEAARQALLETDGDLAAAILKLKHS